MEVIEIYNVQPEFAWYKRTNECMAGEPSNSNLIITFLTLFIVEKQ